MIKQDKFIGTRIPNTLLEKIEAACNQRNEKKSAFIRKAVLALLDSYKQKPALPSQRRSQWLIND
jgi:metal-responsive CopG/Arc/MetJ family transcriptional regulator